jgi:hypothetical protein
MEQIFSKVKKKKKLLNIVVAPCSLTKAKHPPDEKLKERKRKQPLSLCKLIGGWCCG